MIRETLKMVTKKLGIYEFIRVKKDEFYRKTRDASLIVEFCLNKIFKDYSLEEIANFKEEFEKEKVFEYIELKFRENKEANYGYSSPLNLYSLYIAIRLLKPGIFVETGVASGASSYVILKAMEKNGSGALYSIDLPPQDWEDENKEYRNLDKVVLPENKRPGWLVPDSLRKRWTLIYGDARKALPLLLDRLGRIDAFYHDAEHTYEAMLYEYKTVWPRLNPGGVLSSDDVSWNEAFDEFVGGLKGMKAKKYFNFGIVFKK